MRFSDRLPRESGRDYALRILKENIISLDLAPGSLVSESELAAELGLSRTPVREALIELSKVRIVEITPQKPSMIARIDYGLVEEARFLREILECAVVELVCRMASPQDIRRLEETIRLQLFYLEHSVSEQLMLMDDQFHRMLFDMAQKPQLYALLQNFSIHFDRVRRMALESVKELKIVEDHSAILNAIRDNRPQEARELMKLHLSRCQVDAAAIREKYPGFF